MAKGLKIVPSDFNSVFSRLEALRAKHYEGAGQSNEGKNALATAFETTVVETEEKAEEKYSLMKQYLNTLRNSVFLTSLTTDTINTITTPQAGDLISFSNLEIASDVITDVESLPFTNTGNFSGFNPNGNFFTCFGFTPPRSSDFTCFSFSAPRTSNFSPFCTKCFNPFCECFASFSGSALRN